MAMSGTRKAILIIGGIFAVLILVVGVGVLSLWLAFRKTEPPIRDNSVLMLRVAGTLPDYTPDDPFKNLRWPGSVAHRPRDAVQKSEGR